MLSYDDIVMVAPEALPSFRPGERAWVIGITQPQDRRGAHFDQFPPGIVYLVEFEDGDALDIHESLVSKVDD